MSDYFVDAGAGAGGNGLSPGSAYISMQSIVWNSGDRAWLRRTHIESAGIGVAIMSTPWEESWSRRFQVIGWPDVNDPFFIQRPVSGQSAGWDSDVPSTAVYSVFGLKFPTLNSSGTSATLFCTFGGGFETYNIAFNQAGSSNRSPFLWDANFAYMDNVTFLRQMGAYPQFQFVPPTRNTGKFILIQSGNISLNNTGTPIFARHLVIHSACVMVANKYPLHVSNAALYYPVVENQCNSLTALIGDSARADFTLPFGLLIERFIGNSPPYLVNPLFGGNLPFDITIEDYLGSGPLQYRFDEGTSYVIASTLQAYYNSDFAFYVNVRSWAANYQDYGTRIGGAVAFRKVWPVNSAQTYEIEVPVYIGSSQVWSVEPSQMPRVSWNVLGSNGLHQPYSIVPGSAGLWSGSFVAGGSAWIAKYRLTSNENLASNLLSVHPRAPLQAVSGDALTGYMMIAEPYSV